MLPGRSFHQCLCVLLLRHQAVHHLEGCTQCGCTKCMCRQFFLPRECVIHETCNPIIPPSHNRTDFGQAVSVCRDTRGAGQHKQGGTQRKWTSRQRKSDQVGAGAVTVKRDGTDEARGDTTYLLQQRTMKTTRLHMRVRHPVLAPVLRCDVLRWCSTWVVLCWCVGTVEVGKERVHDHWWSLLIQQDWSSSNPSTPGRVCTPLNVVQELFDVDHPRLVRPVLGANSTSLAWGGSTRCCGVLSPGCTGQLKFHSQAKRWEWTWTLREAGSLITTVNVHDLPRYDEAMCSYLNVSKEGTAGRGHISQLRVPPVPEGNVDATLPVLLWCATLGSLTATLTGLGGLM